MNVTKLIIIFTLFVFLIQPVSAADWIGNTSLIAGLGDIGNGGDDHSNPAIFYDLGIWKLISGDAYGNFHGFQWNTSTLQWDSNSSIVTGLPDVGTYSTPTVFYDAGTWKLISGEGDGYFNGFEWNTSTSQWDSNSTLAIGLGGGLGDIGGYSAPEVFYDSGTWKLITGIGDGSFHGFEWNGTGWDSDSSIVTGLIDVGDNSAPTIFNVYGTWKLISGEIFGTFRGYEWNTSTLQWDSDSLTGLTDVGFYSKPTVFYDSGTWKLMSGDISGSFHGYEMILYAVSGTVTNPIGSPIVGVEVTINSLSDTTNTTGYYTIPGHLNGDYIIMATASGYNLYTGSVAVSGDTTKDFTMIETTIPIISAISNFISPPSPLPPSPPAPVYVIEKITIESVINDMSIYISTPSNWIVLLFAYIGALIGTLLLIKNTEISIIIVNTLLGGTTAWLLVLSVNFGIFQLISGNQITDPLMLGIVGMIAGIVLTHFFNSEGRM